MTIIINEVSNSTLTDRLESVDTNFEQKIENTVALAFQGIVYGNISAISERSTEILKQLDSTYKKYIPAKYDTKQAKWVFSKAKALKVRDLLDITVDVTTFEEFMTALNSVEDKIEIAKNNEAAQVTPEEKLAADKLKVSKYLSKALDGSLTVLQLESIVATLKAKGAK
tara:strand:+ start:366 stop:872 length:507 start_codon:yes stop_codon:yes gene_type:complete